MENLLEINQGPRASSLMHRLAALAVHKNGGEPITPKAEDIAALEAAQANLRAAGLHTGSCAVGARVEAVI